MRIFIAVALSLLGLGCADPPPLAQSNVLLITLDTTRPDRMSCYGYEKSTTPNIDAIAGEGLRFARAMATAGVTPISHASILTGNNNLRHGLRVFPAKAATQELSPVMHTLASLLAAEGYATAAFVSAYSASEAYGLDHGFDRFDSQMEAANIRANLVWNQDGSNDSQRRSDLTIERAMQWLEQQSGPWCLWVHLFDVHDFAVVPPVDFIRSQGITEYPRPGAVGRKNVEWRERMYDPELTFMDMQVGRLVHWLRNQDQWDDTLTVITADHGQGLLDGLRRHGWVRHRFLYDWCLRVPLIVRAPLAHQGTLPQGSSWSGRVVDAQVRTIDILPSILELLGVEPPQLDGLSFWRLAEELEETPRIAFADALNLLCLYDPAKGQWPEHCVDNLYSVSDGTWKLIYHAVSPENHELFHLLNDPLEATNLALQHPEHVGRLTALLLEQEGAGLTDPVAASSAADAAPDQLEKLQALGYIER